MSTPKLLIAYDGSPNAQSAMHTVAGLFPGATAVLFYARQPLEGFAAHLEGHPALEKLQGLDAAALDVSEQIAADGAQLARDLGLIAEPLISSTMATASEAIVDTAEELNVDLIVLGSRGRRGFKATLLGSTSASVLHHATRPTLVIPSDAVAAARRNSRVATPAE
ncbi:Nucleotide-binding universal stress protein, UspA family [Cryobacterium flavum]|uniref:Universal stress protein n=1 Tax=Cryobacterium flavum TaxID=1424659 RepID=A0A4R8V1C2_9MICO|nr:MULTISPECIES: universal stress protein [Cryobacterium]TFB75997.1 universal stress protein [Cryobacterium flavum]SDO05304.1 Nucleotide-binding universal stress protein, UspA family [Cryobacterium flavum]